MRKNVLLILTICLVCLTCSSLFVAADNNQNKTLEARNALENAKADMLEMAESGFSVQLVNDTLFEAEQIFIAQNMLEQPDYSFVLVKTKSIAEIKRKAFSVYDELNALSKKLEKEEAEENMSEAYTIFEKAKQEFYDERYDKAMLLIEECYVKINEIHALRTKIRAIYEAGTSKLVRFFRIRWKVLSITLAVLLILFFSFRKKVAILFVKRKINNLKFEKDVLKNLIKKTQYEYFQKGKIPESLYHIRIDKFGTLIRDINRQIPLLEEAIERIKRIGKKKAEKKR